MKITMPSKKPAFCPKKGFSCKDLHIAIVDIPNKTPVLSAFAYKLKPLEMDSQMHLQDAVEAAVKEYANHRDVTMLVTLPGWAYWPKEQFVDFVGYCQFHGDVKRLCCATSDCIVLMTQTDYTVTIRIFGNNKLLEATTESKDESFDSFEEEEGLTQDILPAMKMSPMRTRKQRYN
ncbi:hypothetical protein SEMRO_323_G117400.1 [Seminavis robusta]|uniref:Uncharacterized protein n=1 Tax=Seminavis robusta TaxID=568900 RepID=A0A9N8DXN7_9STRA|nr:hypothetical protein SEMRO_323_G117400.1 [Seminavis robusta]|eukprot:Sro323_g117400.1 n/a (176) ;mRNA; f:69624-70151